VTYLFGQEAKKIIRNLLTKTMLRSSVTKVAGQHSRVLTSLRYPSTIANNTLPLWNIQPTAVRAFSAPRSTSWDGLAERSRVDGGTAQPWQAEGAVDIQRVTQQAMIHELIQQQTNTIQSVVPWFLQNMTPSYFRQVPEKYRIDHIKAIAAIEGTKQTQNQKN
jgi:hypothetical protein